MHEEILRPVGDNALGLLEKGAFWGSEAKHHMSENELRILHHLERYQFAAKTINTLSSGETSILDIGAGEGLGLSVIYEDCITSPIVHAIELDSDACNTMHRRLPQVYCHNMSVDDFQFDIEFDYALLFETLGHQYIVSDFQLLKKINAQILLLSIPYYRQHEKKFYCYRLYDPVSIKELLEHAMPNYTTDMFGQFHPVNRKDKLESGIIAFEDLNRDPDFIICRTAKCYNLIEKG